MRMTRTVSVTLVLSVSALALVPTEGLAQRYNMVVAGDRGDQCFNLPPPIDFHVVEWALSGYPYVEASPSVSVDATNEIVTIAAAGNGRVLAAVYRPEAHAELEIVEIREDLSRVPFFKGAGRLRADAMVVDRRGNVYVLAQGSGSKFIIAISATGTLLSIQPISVGSAPIDLSADQCTLLLARAGGIVRYNVCTGSRLADIALDDPSTYRGLRILPNGDILIAEGPSLRRYSDTGSLLREHRRLESVWASALAIGSGGATALLGDDCARRVVEVDLTSGQKVREARLRHTATPYSIVPLRGFTAAIGSLARSDIPSASDTALFALFVLLALVAVRRIV